MNEVPIRIKYLVNFLDITGKREEVFPFARGSDLNTLAQWLKNTYGIDPGAPNVLFLINGHGWAQNPLGMKRELKEGDTVILMPLLSGG